MDNKKAPEKKHRKVEPDILMHNIHITTVILVITTAISFAFFASTDSTENISTFYILAIVFIARFTDGYIPGILASLISVICINWGFTYPYLALNFSLNGYPLTFLVMLLIATLTSTATTHLKEKNRILHKQEKLLMEAEKEKLRANLLRAISHDLRTPLTSIIGNSAAYLDNDKTLSRRDKHLLIQNIYDDSNWLLNMVENLLSVTRIHETGAQVTKSLEPLEEVISEAVRRFKKRLPNAHVNVTIPNDFIMIPMDATLIIQVILNLLENAVYHSQSDEPLNLVCSINDTHAQFEVIDHGVGIKEELLDTLFDGYVSTPNSNSDSHKGMGIGLSICKAIIVAHNGKIWAVNDGDGAHIIFILPLGEETYET
ncbi:sensor histidine kinase [Lachnoclostridium edouardi]|uniref:sensor histidine kinase n=1 Tax=Lachnoclostridium edouardi TaxID=1926283 RepID=UPI001FA837AF|nr:DUF4118 domain-containing protein [Lachnoclostridium edouardi]